MLAERLTGSEKSFIIVSRLEPLQRRTPLHGMDRFEVGTLRAYYGALITDRQNEFIRLHYDEDISLGEIAEMYSVSRQAALDAIKRGESALAEYEEKLHLVSREKKVAAVLGDALGSLEAARYGECAEYISRAKALLEE